METLIITDNILVFRLRAHHFPSGIKSVHEKMHQLFPPDGQRKYYGISQAAGKGKILYWAAVNRLPTDKKSNESLEIFDIKKGKYATVYLKNWQKEETIVAKTFQQLLTHPLLDPNGYCLEEYINHTDMRCSVPLL